MPNANRVAPAATTLPCPGCGDPTTDVYPVARITVAGKHITLYGCRTCARRLVEPDVPPPHA